MTHVDNQGRGDAEEVPDYEKFTAIQKEFWDTCTSSFVFGMQSFKVDIAQCMIAKDEEREGRASSDGGHQSTP
jgi:hypothetical protein